MLRGIQFLAHVSHFNLVNWYNRTFVDDSAIPQFVDNQAFTAAMSEAVCGDGLDLQSLLDHADRRGKQLTVSASGTDHLRFEDAMREHLDLLAVEGTRDRDHYCSRCVRIQSGGTDPATGEEILLDYFRHPRGRDGWSHNRTLPLQCNNRPARRAGSYSRTSATRRPLYQTS
ncbi:uncharacterized protein MELLADRAFT_85689 [Melampsora larici-populina 98AG31]|uniref:CxC5 like cysteine cluster associated with KDZ domain-containing protein n=1 Tax=Melampsora larici-populina (strain 98AG31 / pathotype 3-4-7) TaxID=747676 RepID=F4RJF6_MELLP|nr:uncharacterized protein MELLADRAFT_85689 [Melampsora larici-populina 98AG31]EGG07303.1 hypothetical protein MELLADRAFT_85689 [Melampsora larici-populina 98AG31]